MLLLVERTKADTHQASALRRPEALCSITRLQESPVQHGRGAAEWSDPAPPYPRCDVLQRTWLSLPGSSPNGLQLCKKDWAFQAGAEVLTGLMGIQRPYLNEEKQEQFVNRYPECAGRLFSVPLVAQGSSGFISRPGWSGCDCKGLSLFSEELQGLAGTVHPGPQEAGPGPTRLAPTSQRPGSCRRGHVLAAFAEP